MTDRIDPSPLIATKAVILARVSSKEQEDGYSIDAQRHRLEVYCQRRNLDVLRVFEITESSTRGDRTKFMDMIKFCKAQKHPIAVVADKVDRVQRSFKEHPLLDALIQSGKIELHFNTEGYVIHRNSVSQERLMWSFGVIMAQSYVDSLRDNVKRSFDQKIRSGEFIAKAPIGYLNSRENGRSTIIVDPFRSVFIQRIFSEYATGLRTIPELTELAADWGLRMPSGGKIARSQIHKLLNNSFYYGVMTIKGKQYPHKYPPLINSALFMECQRIMKGWNKKPFKYGNKEFVFRGLLSCVATGKTISAFNKTRTYKNGDKGEWTYLRSWNKDGKAIYTREEKVIAQAEHAFKALALPSEAVAAVTEYLRYTERSERDFRERRSEELVKEGNRIRARMDGLMDLLMDGTISRDDYDRRRVQLRERQMEVENELAGHTDSDDTFKNAMLFFIDMCSKAGDLFKNSTVEEKRRYLNLVFSNLRLDGGKLCYSYRIPFSDYVELKENNDWRRLVDNFRTSSHIRAEVIKIAKRLEEISLYRLKTKETANKPPLYNPTNYISQEVAGDITKPLA